MLRPMTSFAGIYIMAKTKRNDSPMFVSCDLIDYFVVNVNYVLSDLFYPDRIKTSWHGNAFLITGPFLWVFISQPWTSRPSSPTPSMQKILVRSLGAFYVVLHKLLSKQQMNNRCSQGNAQLGCILYWYTKQALEQTVNNFRCDCICWTPM